MPTHYGELRRRFMLGFGAVMVAMVGVYCVKEPLLALLLSPLQALPNAPQVQATGVGELFFTYLKIAGWGGLFLALPFLFWQVWAFLSPGLYSQEKKLLLPALVAVPALFYSGGLFAFYVLVPLIMAYFLGFSQPEVLLQPKLADYLSFISTLMFAVGAAFNVPVVLVLLMVWGFVTPAQLGAARRWVIVGVFVLAAIVTPPDPFSQSALALPILGLYEVAILVGKSMKPKK